MKNNKSKEHILYAINPNDDKDYYSNYHKRKKTPLYSKESELPNIKNIPNHLKTEINSVQDTKIDFNLSTKQSLFNPNDSSFDNYRASSINYSINSPFLNTEKIAFPKISPILTHIKNFKSLIKTKYPKKNGLLSIKYLDLINMDKKNKMLIYEITKNDKMFEREILNNIIDSNTKKIIINELKNIDKKTSQQIENIMKNTTKEAKEESLRYLQSQPRIVYLGAEEIFEEFSNPSRIETSKYFNKFEEKIKDKKKKIKKNKLSKLNDIFLDFAKNNIRRKIELRNQFNQEISVEYITKLLNNQIRKIIFLLSLYNSDNGNDNLSVFPNDLNESFLSKGYYNSLVSPINPHYRSRNNQNDYLFSQNRNIFDKSKFSNERFNTEKEYINALINQIPKYSEDNEENSENILFNQINNINYSNLVKTSEDKSLFYFYNKNNITSPFDILNKHSNTIDLKQRNKLRPLKKKNLNNEENNFKVIHSRNNIIKIAENYESDIKVNGNNKIKDMNILDNEEERNKINTIINKNENEIDIKKNNNNFNIRKNGNNNIEDNNNYNNPNNNKNKNNYSNNYTNINNEINNNNLNIYNDTNMVNNIKDIGNNYTDNYSIDYNPNNNNFNNNDKRNNNKNNNINIYRNNEKIKLNKANKKNLNTYTINKSNNLIPNIKNNFNKKNEKRNQENLKDKNITNSEHSKNIEYIEDENNKENEKNNENKSENIQKKDIGKGQNKLNNKNINKNINDKKNKQILDSKELNKLNNILQYNNNINKKYNDKIDYMNSSNNSPNKNSSYSSSILNSYRKDEKNNNNYNNNINYSPIKEYKSPKQNKKSRKSKGRKNNENKFKTDKNVLNSTNKSDQDDQNELSSIINNNVSDIEAGNNKNLYKLLSDKTLPISNSDNIIIQKKRIKRNSLFIQHQTPEKLVIEDKNLRRCVSEGDLLKKERKKTIQVNVIKLQDNDIDLITNFINEEEKKKINAEKNVSKIEKENNEKEPEDTSYNDLKKENKKENFNKYELTRDDIIEKLKSDDWRIREYVEQIVRAGLTVGDKKLNNQMKNRTILVYKDHNLGNFKFKKNKNFGIKDDIELEPIRPLSKNKGKIDEIISNDNKDNKANKDNIENIEKIDNIKKIDKIKNIDNINKKKKKIVKILPLKNEESRKELIYDNTYLFSNNKKSVNIILRKEVEEILKGGILLQKKDNEDKKEKKEKKVNFKKNVKINNIKKEYKKKKGENAKLFNKSIFLNDLKDEEVKKENTEDSRLQEIQKLENKKEQSLDFKLKAFINKIKRLKIEGVTEGIGKDEIDDYITQLYNRNSAIKERENRIREFLFNLNDYRYGRIKQREFKDTYFYREPIIVENKMVENYEESITSYRNRNNSERKNYKIREDSGLSFNIKNLKKYGSIKDKSYMTQINY